MKVQDLVSLDPESITLLKEFLDIFTLSVLQEADRIARHSDLYQISTDIFKEAWQGLLPNRSFSAEAEATFWQSKKTVSSTAPSGLSNKFSTLKEIIKNQYGKNGINVGDEGGFAPPIHETKEALDMILCAVEENGYAKKIMIALDCAASSFYENGKYLLKEWLTSDELLDFYCDLVEEFPVISIEDPFAEDDWYGFVEITKKLGGNIQIIGDDLFVPVMNFVFGLASKFYGSITSFYRLKGLEMKTKISIHECGHVLGLEHCQNYCVMQYSNSLPEAQQKPSTLCDECKKKLEQIRCNYNEDDAR